MGAVNGKQTRKRRDALREGNACAKSCPGLKPKHVKTLYKLFRKADKDQSGEISVLEFLMFFDIDRTVFAVKAFTHMDDDKSGEIDFPEFVKAAWAFVSLSKEGLRNFAFSIYDLDDSGSIDRFEVEAMVHELYGSQWRRSRLARQTLKELAARKQLSRAEFVDFARTHPALLFPAFQLQGSLRTALGGARMWASIAETRARAADVPPPPPPPLTATGRGRRMAQQATADVVSVDPPDAAPRRFSRQMAPSASRLRLDELRQAETLRPPLQREKAKRVLDEADIRNWRDGAPHLDLARNSQLIKQKVEVVRPRPPRPDFGGDKENFYRPKASQFEARRGHGDQFGPRTSAVERTRKRRPLGPRA